jgi:hypothetical protein
MHLSWRRLEPGDSASDAGTDDAGGVRVAVLDTGRRKDRHPDGVDLKRVTAHIDAVRAVIVVPRTSAAASVTTSVFDGLWQHRRGRVERTVGGCAPERSCEIPRRGRSATATPRRRRSEASVGPDPVHRMAYRGRQ